MGFRSEIRLILRSILFAAAVALCMAGNANPEGSTQATATKVVQFDAIIELNAPILRSHVVLFARYWVAASFYRIAVVWAEPHAITLNFPMHPVTMTVDSNDQKFCVANQIHASLGGMFSKPVDARPIFRHRLNSYPIGDMRFTETEALASRIYRDDLRMLAPWFAEGLHTVDVNNSPGRGKTRRDIATLNLHISNAHVDTVDIVDANDLLGRVDIHGTQQRSAASWTNARKLRLVLS